MKLKKDEKGFTLVELIVVMIILAILAALLVPALVSYIDEAKDKQLIVNGRTCLVAAQASATQAYGMGDEDWDTYLEHYIGGDLPNGRCQGEAANGVVTKVTYFEGSKKAEWTKASGKWEVTATQSVLN
ncbi:MAG: type II secretion system protein [Erysipelotrichaceae bacterium]|nr:type II secretion system protein [Erysipelotrichaceae bacterium]